jgi:hypothetical protein
MKMKTLNLVLLGLTLLINNATVALAEAAPAAPAAESSPRAGKTAYGALELIGFTIMPVSGLRLGYYVNSNLAAEVGYASGSAKIGSFESDKKIIEAKAKYFVGDTFYIDGGIGHEMWTTEYSVLTADSLIVSNSVKGKVSNTGIEFHIGNQWQVTHRVMDWDVTGLMIGCDWIGYFKSLSTQTSFGSASNLDAADKKREEASVKTAFGGSSLHLARFYVGWAF